MVTHYQEMMVAILQTPSPWRRGASDDALGERIKQRDEKTACTHSRQEQEYVSIHAAIRYIVLHEIVPLPGTKRWPRTRCSKLRKRAPSHENRARADKRVWSAPWRSP